MKYLKTFKQFVNEELEHNFVDTYNDFLQEENLAEGFEDGVRELSYEDKQSLENLGVDKSYYRIKYIKDGPNSEIASEIVENILKDQVTPIEKADNTSENVNIEKYQFNNSGVEFIILDRVFDTKQMTEIDIFIHPDEYAKID